MLGNKAAVQVVAEKLSAYPDIPVVLDPVLISTSGRPLGSSGRHRRLPGAFVSARHTFDTESAGG